VLQIYLKNQASNDTGQLSSYQYSYIRIKVMLNISAGAHPQGK
jgi:hypothetical protein